MVRERLALENLAADVGLGDAEDLGEFPDNFFDVYYSWGVLTTHRVRNARLPKRIAS